jgi:hypothetical protein
MATSYVVLREDEDDTIERTTVVGGGPIYFAETVMEAANAMQACRKVAEDMSETELDGGVTLIAVPARNWNSGRHTLKAETQRRIRSA